jgi:hypothetical protein
VLGWDVNLWDCLGRICLFLAFGDLIAWKVLEPSEDLVQDWDKRKLFPLIFFFFCQSFTNFALN